MQYTEWRIMRFNSGHLRYFRKAEDVTIIIAPIPVDVNLKLD